MSKFDTLILNNVIKLVCARKNAELSQWQLAVRADCNVTHVRRVEKGDTNPGIMLAIRLVSALNLPVGEFFKELAHKANLNGNIVEVPKKKCNIFIPIPSMEISPTHVKFLFGLFFKESRVSLGIMQKHIIECAHYTQRNMIKVEKGEQEPAVMTAVAMVCALGIDLELFLSSYICFIKASPQPIPHNIQNTTGSPLYSNNSTKNRYCLLYTPCTYAPIPQIPSIARVISNP